METSKHKWQGKRAIIVVRQSDDKDGTGSTEAQLDYMRKDLTRVGMLYVDKVVLEGVKGSAPALTTEVLEKLFTRKKEKKDFDVIAWQLEDRASRGGGEFGMWIEHEAKRRGLLVYFAGDEGTTIPFAPVVRVAKYEAAKQGSVGNGRRSTQGQKWAQKKGFFRTAGHTPIGCDRLYCDAGGNPKFIIHNLPSGLQEQLDWTTRKVIGTYGNEFSLLVPTTGRERQVVRVIFYLRYKRGWHGAKIANYLNRLGIPSASGKEWSQRQVQIIYENDAYTGVTYNDKTFSGRFFRRDKVMGFVALDRDECDLVIKKTFAPKLRPIDDWEKIDQPYMYDFLPRGVRDFAITALAKMWKERTDPNCPKKKPNAHPASDFLLSDRLAAMQDEGTLIGTMSGPPDHKTAYYRHRRSKRGYRKGSVFNNLIPAKPLHEAVAKLIAEVLGQAPDLRSRLKEYLLEQRSAAAQDQPDISRLEAERDELRQQISIITKTLTGAALADAAPELKKLGDRRNAVEDRLNNAHADHKQDERPMETILDEAIAVLADQSQRLLSLPIEPLRSLVNHMITEATVDMETKAVELKLALPTWALQPLPKKKAKNDPLSPADALCPATSSRSQAGGWTQVPLGSAECTYQHRRGSTTKPACYVCRRIAA
jgi:hypothetical protein